MPALQTCAPRLLAVLILLLTGLTVALVAGTADGATTDSIGAQAARESQLIHLLQSQAPPADKAMACKQLALCGTRKAVPALAALLSDYRLASWARIALEAIPDPAADAALRKAMGKLHGTLLIGAINSTGVRRDTEAVRGLIRRLGDPDAAVASAAAAALGRIGGAKAGTALERSLAGAPEAVRPAVAEACVVCAEGLLDQGKTADAVKLYDSVRLASVPKQNMLEATRGAILARRSAGLPLLLEQLRSPDPARFGIGVRTARELPGREVTEALAREVEVSHPERQAILLLALGDRRDEAVLPAVLKTARSGPPRLRIVAVGVLDRLGDPSAVPVLLEAATAGDAELAMAARGVLLRLPGNEVDADLLARLPQAAGKTCQVLIELAAKRRLDRALPTIIKFAEDPDVEVCLAAVRAIGVLGDDRQAAGLVRLIQKIQDPRERAEIETALIAIGGRSGSACEPLVLPLARSSDSSLRTIALHVLAAVDGREALAAVKAAVDDADEAVQDEAVRTLSTWPNNWPEDSGIAEPLLTLARSGRKTSYQVLGLRGYLQYVQGDKQIKNSEKLNLVRDSLPLIKRPEEQRMAIAMLSVMKDPAALELLIALAATPSVADDACSAVVDLMREESLAVTVEQRRKALQMVVEKTSNAETRKVAEEMLGKMR